MLVVSKRKKPVPAEATITTVSMLRFGTRPEKQSSFPMERVMCSVPTSMRDFEKPRQ